MFALLLTCLCGTHENAVTTTVVTILDGATADAVHVAASLDRCGRRCSMGPSSNMEVTNRSEDHIEGWPGRCDVRPHLYRITLSMTICTRYLLNPYIFLPSLALSSSSLENALALLSLMFACRGEPAQVYLTNHTD